MVKVKLIDSIAQGLHIFITNLVHQLASKSHLFMFLILGLPEEISGRVAEVEWQLSMDNPRRFQFNSIARCENRVNRC